MEIQANLDIYAYYEKEAPIYRVWINNILYNERVYWIDPKIEYIEEVMYFELDPGEHTILVEKISAPEAKIWLERAVIRYKDRKLMFDLSLDPKDKEIIKFTIE